MDVSVCVVNWNTRELLRNCLRSIETKTHGVDYEVILVDNDSSDGTVEMVAEQFPWVGIVTPNANLGFARGSNLAAENATGDYILYLNPDTELVTDALFGMWTFLKNHPECGAVGCKLLNSDGTIQQTCASTFPTARNELSSLLLLNRLFPFSRLLSSRELNYWDHEESRHVDCLSGACMMLRRSEVTGLRGFDDSLFMYGEDVDMCARLKQQGFLLHYLANEVIYHHEGAASKKKGRSFAPLRQRAANCYVLQKNFGRTRAYGYRLAVFVGTGIRLVAGCLFSPIWVVRGSDGLRTATDFLGRHKDLLLWSVGLKRLSTR